MAITLDTTWSFDSAGSGASHQIPSFHTPTAGCNLIVVGIITGGGSVTTVTDTSGNTYTVLGPYSTPGAEKLFVAYSIPTTLGSIKFTANFSPNTRSTIMGASFLGTASSSSLDVTVATTAANGTGTTLTSANGTTVKANEVLVAFGGNDNGSSGNTWTAGGSFTIITSQTTGAVAPPSVLMYQVLSSTGTQTAAATVANSAGWAIAYASFADTAVSAGSGQNFNGAMAMIGMGT